MLSYMLTSRGEELVVICLETSDLLAIAHGSHLELPLRDLQAAATFEEVGHLERAKVVILPPGASEELLRVAGDAAAAGRDVRISNLKEPGGSQT